MALVVERSACGCTLKTGTIVIAVLQALAGFSIMVSEAIAAYKHPDSKDYTLSAAKNTTAAMEEQEVNKYVKGQPGLCTVLSIAGGLQFFLSILLLYGTDYENPRLVKPWIVFSMILTSIIIAVYFGLAIITFAVGYRTVGTTILLGIIFTTGVSTYFILVVYSFYRYLIERNCQPWLV